MAGIDLATQEARPRANDGSGPKGYSPPMLPIAVALLLFTSPPSSRAMDSARDFPELSDKGFLVFEHHHRCDYLMKPWKEHDGRIIQRILSYRDVLTGYFLRVAPDGRRIAAIDAAGHLVWETDPHEGVLAYRYDPPCVFTVGPDYQSGVSVPPHVKFRGWSNQKKRVVELVDGVTGHYVWLRFDNSQFGVIDVRTGDFIFEGQN